MRGALPHGNRKDVATVSHEHEQLTYLIHDMRSVVTSVSLMVDMLELAAKAENDSIQRSRAVSAQNSCRQMAMLCTEAAELLTGTADEDPVSEKFDLLEMLVEVATVYSPIFNLAGKTLKLDIKHRSPRCFGNRSQMFRAVSNLLDNGLKHTSRGSTVVITCTDSLKEFTVSISDDGPGMADLAAGNVRPINSLPVVVKDPSDSTALIAPGTGLRFVSEVATRHGGSSMIELNERGGTTVTLKFLKHKIAQFRSA